MTCLSFFRYLTCRRGDILEAIINPTLTASLVIEKTEEQHIVMIQRHFRHFLHKLEEKRAAGTLIKVRLLEYIERKTFKKLEKIQMKLDSITQ